jgi:hypothetical protein
MGTMLTRIIKGINLAAITGLVISLLSAGAWATSPPAPLPQTGQTGCWSAGRALACVGTGQDGDHQMGVVWPNPRFADN